MVGAAAPDRERDLHERVRVEGVALLMEVIAGVGRAALGEVEDFPARVHGEVFEGEFLHPATIRAKSISCW